LCISSVSGFTDVIMKAIPKSVKISTIMGMGLQIALVGMTSVNMVVSNELTIVGLGPIYNLRLWLSLLGLLIIGTLLYHQVTGAILIGICFQTLITWYLEDTFPKTYIDFPTTKLSPSDLINFSGLDWFKIAPAIMAFLFIGIVDVSGVVFGMSSLANLTEPNGHVPGSLFSFLGCGLGSIVGASFGSAPLIVYVESAAGIEEGARTGLSALFISFIFFSSAFLAPLFSQVPVTATSPVSMLVGAMMMSQAHEIDWNDMSEAIPAFLTMTIMPFTFSITNGIVFGLLAAGFFYISTGKAYYDMIRPRVAKTGVLEDTALVPLATEQLPPVFNPVVRTPSLIVSKKTADAILKARLHDSHVRTGSLPTYQSHSALE